MIIKISQIKIIVSVVMLYVLSIAVVLLSNKPAQAATDTADLSTTVQASLSFSITAGETVAFGPLTAGVPIVAPNGGTIASVTTNAANGYTLGVSDGVAAANSVLLHTDTTTRITDVTSGTIGTPAAWGASTGLGITMWDADTSPEGKWCAGTCTSYDDSDNLYAAIPQAATTAHTVTGAVVGADTSSWAFKLDVPADQKTGTYSGNVTFTATAVLS